MDEVVEFGANIALRRLGEMAQVKCGRLPPISIISVLALFQFSPHFIITSSQRNQPKRLVFAFPLILLHRILAPEIR